jgi:hypothetical protein
MTTNATCINVKMPEGINAANVPPKIIAADNTTAPIFFAASIIASLDFCSSSF